MHAAVLEMGTTDALSYDTLQKINLVGTFCATGAPAKPKPMAGNPLQSINEHQLHQCLQHKRRGVWLRGHYKHGRFTAVTMAAWRLVNPYYTVAYSG